MNAAHKRLVLCKREDWKLIRSENIELIGDAIATRRAEFSTGFACLGEIDAGERGFVWGRVSLDALLPPDTSIRTYAYASDARPDVADGIEYAPAGGSEDFYLDARGRYLWLKFVFTCSDVSPTLRAVRLVMAGDHMIDYLPEIYRVSGDFTKRFLSIFDSMATDMEREIERLHARFDIDGAGGDMLRYLAGWLCAEDAAEMGDDDLREYMRSLWEGYASMYTPDGVKRSVKRLCGREPLLIESADVDPNSRDCPDPELYRKLYGENPYRFFILLPDDTFGDGGALAAFTREMAKLVPANTSFSTVLLARGVQLDRHCYLSINSTVSGYAPAVIDVSRAMNFETTIGGQSS
jgi:phage tail-like protein